MLLIDTMEASKCMRYNSWVGVKNNASPLQISKIQIGVIRLAPVDYVNTQIVLTLILTVWLLVMPTLSLKVTALGMLKQEYKRQ